MSRVILSVLICVCAQVGLAQAQDKYPSRPVRIIVPSPPAGGTDIIARVLAQNFSTAFGQQFIVENRPGAGNMIGIELVARSAPDGYTLLMVPSTLALNPRCTRRSTTTRSRISRRSRSPPPRRVLVVHPSCRQDAHRIRCVGQEEAGRADLRHAGDRHLAAYEHGAAQEHGGVGHSAHPVSRHLARRDRHHQRADPARCSPTRSRRSRKSIPARCAPSRSPVPSASRPCPIFRRSHRPAFPDTKRPNGTGCSRRPAHPEDIVVRLHAEATRLLHTADMKEKLATDGAEPVGSTSAEFAALIKSELDKWAKVAQRGENRAAIKRLPSLLGREHEFTASARSWWKPVSEKIMLKQKRCP